MEGTGSEAWGQRFGLYPGSPPSTLPVPVQWTHKEDPERFRQSWQCLRSISEQPQVPTPQAEGLTGSASIPPPEPLCRVLCPPGLTRVLAFRNTWLSISLLDLLWATPAFLMASSLQDKRTRMLTHTYESAPAGFLDPDSSCPWVEEACPLAHQPG